MADFDLSPELRVDDPSIPNEARLWRQFDPAKIRPDDSISEGEFRTHEMSVWLDGQVTLDDVRAMDVEAGVAEITVGEVRSFDLIVASGPDPAHKYVYRRDNPGQRLTGGQAARLGKCARIAWRPS